MNTLLTIQGISLEEFSENLRSQLRGIVREEIKAALTAELQDKLLSPIEVCKLFKPQIAKKTLHVWTEKGIVKKHSIGGRVYYKYSEIMAMGTSLKKYQLQKVA
jgi:hypothetical protein